MQHLDLLPQLFLHEFYDKPYHMTPKHFSFLPLPFCFFIIALFF